MMKFQLVIGFDDCTVKSEMTNDLQAALGAIQIYLEMPDAFVIHLIDNYKEQMIFNWCRD